MKTLGFDTSNYTTSCAVYDGICTVNKGKLLPVKQGELGLRQSEALFQHVKALPQLLECLKAVQELSGIQAVGASGRPRAVEKSYMPCFLAGTTVAKGIAEVMGLPYCEFSHQQGHLAAVLWETQNLNLIEGEFLAWHLSGGTTELLHVMPGLYCRRIGGTKDISAGQLIDRTGQILGVPFPSGKTLDMMGDKIAVKAFPIRLDGLEFSLSGMQNQVIDRNENGVPPEDIAAFAVSCVADIVRRTTIRAREEFGTLPVVFAGGVASNRRLRRVMEQYGGIFSSPEYATDNAAGIAVLTAYGGEIYAATQHI